MRARGLFAGMALAVAACSGTTPYRNDAPKNLHARIDTESGVRAALHVHEVTGPCATRYAGTVSLDAPAVELGIPGGQPTYLVVTFDTSSFLGGSRATSVATTFEPRQGFDYELAVRYRQAIYDVSLKEVDSRRRTSRDLPRRALAGC
jgi:hypothetical protein